MTTRDPLYPPIEPFEQGMLDVGDGHAVYWERCGNPAGKPALVLHGGPGSGCTAMHRRFFDPAAWCVTLFDQRGCGRSTPHASVAFDPATNTTAHLVADIEALRVTFGVERWTLLGNSWGSTLALVYAEAYPERVEGIVLGGVTTTRRREIDWLYRGGVAPLFPEQWERFQAGVSPELRDLDVIDAYATLLADADTAVAARAATAWCEWESATIGAEGEPRLTRRFQDPAYALAFARIVTHYFRHGAWLEEEQVLRDAGRLAGIPGVLVQGRLDLQGPLVTAWELARSWPDAELQVVDASHSAFEVAMAAELVAATDGWR